MKISEKIFYIGVNDPGKRLFENQWPLPYGVSYNSYLLVADKVALIDTVDICCGPLFIQNIKDIIGDKPIDYLIVNHMEPDHSSQMSLIREHYPNITILANPKAIPMIEGFQGINTNVVGVKETDIIDLGGLTLQFKFIPMVHWPETMVTYCPEEKTVFSGDAFGTFGRVEGKMKDRFDEFKEEMARYYTNIVGKYGMQVQMALKKISVLDIKRICSTHGPIWEEEIPQVVDLYNKLSSYEGKKGVCLAYSSMYGNTEKAAMALAKELEERGIEYVTHNLCYEHVSFAIRDAFLYNTIVLGSPTYNNEIFPASYNFLHALKSRLLKNRKFASFGSYTWSGGTVKLMNNMATDMKFELINEGIQFNQGYSIDKCDMKSMADDIENSLK